MHVIIHTGQKYKIFPLADVLHVFLITALQRIKPKFFLLNVLP